MCCILIQCSLGTSSELVVIDMILSMQYSSRCVSSSFLPFPPQQHRALTIGFIGLGNMGASMAINVFRNQSLGRGMLVYDIAPQNVERLSKLGASAAKNVAELAAASDVIVTMVGRSHVVRSAVITFALFVCAGACNRQRGVCAARRQRRL